MKRTVKIHRIGLVSAFRTGFIVYGLLGFMFGLLAAAVLIVFSAAVMAALKADFSEFGIVIAVMMPLVCSVALALAGGLMAFLAALTYNITAGLAGGIDVEMEEYKPKLYDDMYGDMTV